MKKTWIIPLVILLVALSCKEDDLLRPYGPDSGKKPNKITDVTYEPIPGGAIFYYTLPLDKSLSYVKAVYKVNGEEKDAIASQYKTELHLEGLPDDNEYVVDLYAVDKKENRSDPVTVTIKPGASPVQVMRESLTYEVNFGGFILKYKNPSRTELSIHIYQKDSLSDNMLFYEAKVFTQPEGEYQVVGLPNIENTFKVFVRDRFENTSEPLEFEARPWREEYLDKSLFRYVGEPSVYDKDDWYAWMGNPINLWDDIVGQWNFAQTGANGSYPHYLCIDLGKRYPIGRMLFQQRLGASEIFNTHCPRTFDLYGVTELPLVNREDPLEGWTKLNENTFEVVRPSGRVPGEPVTTEDLEAAEKGIMFTIDTPYPRPEIRYLRLVFHDSFGGSNMVILGELTFWAQWK